MARPCRPDHGRAGLVARKRRAGGSLLARRLLADVSALVGPAIPPAHQLDGADHRRRGQDPEHDQEVEQQVLHEEEPEEDGDEGGDLVPQERPESDADRASQRRGGDPAGGHERVVAAVERDRDPVGGLSFEPERLLVTVENGAGAARNGSPQLVTLAYESGLLTPGDPA